MDAELLRQIEELTEALGEFEKALDAMVERYGADYTKLKLETLGEDDEHKK